MKAGTARAPKSPKNNGLEEADAELKSEATAIEKLRVQLSSQGAAADKRQVAEFAKRQKAYLDRKIELEKLKRSADSGVQESVKVKSVTTEALRSASEPAQKQKTPTPPPSPKKTTAEKPAAGKKSQPAHDDATPREIAKTQKPRTSRATSPAKPLERSAARWLLWILLVAAAVLVVWLMR